MSSVYLPNISGVKPATFSSVGQYMTNQPTKSGQVENIEQTGQAIHDMLQFASFSEHVISSALSYHISYQTVQRRLMSSDLQH